MNEKLQKAINIICIISVLFNVFFAINWINNYKYKKSYLAQIASITELNRESQARIKSLEESIRSATIEAAGIRTEFDNYRNRIKESYKQFGETIADSIARITTIDGIIESIGTIAYQIEEFVNSL